MNVPAATVFRVIMPVDDMGAAVRFYETVLMGMGEQVSEFRHYFDCAGLVLALVKQFPRDGGTFRPNPDHVYFAVDDLEGTLQRCRDGGASAFDVPDQEPGIFLRPWGERSFYVSDPAGNPLCFVERGTEFRGGRFVP